MKDNSRLLIFPIEIRPYWSRPPVITLALILLNIAIFIFYQGSDEAVVERAYQLYESQQLLDYERQTYLDYLRREDPDSWSEDRKSTRLNSSHVAISYAVFCLKKKNK